ncbi:MAG: hypothetical protein RSD51_03295 [Malacoplasma sp.]
MSNENEPNKVADQEQAPEQPQQPAQAETISISQIEKIIDDKLGMFLDKIMVADQPNETNENEIEKEQDEWVI